MEIIPDKSPGEKDHIFTMKNISSAIFLNCRLMFFKYNTLTNVPRR